MKYKQRPGIVYTEICGERYLIPTRAASESCPYAIRADLFISVIWGMVGKDQPVDAIYRTFGKFMRQPEERVKLFVDRLLSMLCRKGVLLVSEDET